MNPLFLTLFALILGGRAMAADGPAPAALDTPPPHPVTLGVDMAGSYHLLNTPIPYWSHTPYYQALEDLGAKYVCIHLFPELGHGDQNAALTQQKIEAMDAGMRAHGLAYTLSNEDANFQIRAEVTPGINEYERDPGLHRWDVRMEWLNRVLPPVKPGPPAFQGIVYDEADLMQLDNNRYCNNAAPPYIEPNSYDVPFLAATHGLPIEQAYVALVNKAAQVRQQHYEGRVRPFAESLWPDMQHLFARAGWGVVPKALKENLTSVILSVSLGAALQYRDQTDLTVCVDMHNYFYGFPGHSPEAVRSALMMSYWLGADTIYVENMDYHGSPTRYPGASPGGLLNWSDADHYTVTPHGAVVRDFYKNYVPAHPRTIDWRDYRPRVAIIRLPDGAWGQRNSAFRDRLLGNKNMPMDEISAEWLHVWPILTRGVAKDGAISIFNWNVYPDRLPDFFVPIDSVALFDHHVSGPVLDGVECFVVCGHALTRPTFDAVAARVAAGATCIIARRLYQQFATGTPPGKWVIVDDFKDPAVARTLAPFAPESDVARFRFKNALVEFCRGTAKDSVTVKVYERANIAKLAAALVGLQPPPPDGDTNTDGKLNVADLVTLANKLR